MLYSIKLNFICLISHCAFKLLFSKRTAKDQQKNKLKDSFEKQNTQLKEKN